MTEIIKHHLSDALLMAYSAGNLPEAFDLAVATHISLCDECRAKAESFDAVGGALLEEADASAESLGAVSLDATFARIDAQPQDRVAPRRNPNGVFPAPLHDYVGGDLEAVRWRSVGMGVRQAILTTGDRATARLLYIPAGLAMPDHGHRGMELTMVLQGAFQDEDDYFARGDVEIADSDVQHTPVADVHEDCICLAVTDAPLRFTSFMPRIAQKFLRI
ncbi:ChrR family anti-sigma-E factor [Sulfitobacter sp. D35]|uniref:ChrR family anti-sigma-E factor n=1 Tax=Sulfitobacter sp. D35 TaxID=3083252 RepID=UPI00296E8D4F|nr:ChrR family anti-sigma-E factor [Sulfitobacter sp. D35]MDW4500108.1 ChrR family anti-sigma-E factor [Sulfitobacter sp. D35]